MRRFVLIQTDNRSIFVDPSRVSAVDADMPKEDHFVKGRWSARVDLILIGERITFWIDGNSPEEVLEKIEEIVSQFFVLQNGTSVIVG